MRERNETRDPGATRLDISILHRFCRVSPWVPALRSLTLARPGHESEGARASHRVGRGSRMSRWPSSHLTMSNSAVLFVPAARCCARVCPCIRVRPRSRGGRSADRRTMFCCRACEARLIRTRRGAARPMTRDARLSALHRGDFRPGAALPSPALPPDPCSELLAARSSCLAGGVPGRLRSVRRRPETTDNDRQNCCYNSGLILYFGPLMSDKIRYVSVAKPVLAPGVEV